MKSLCLPQIFLTLLLRFIGGYIGERRSFCQIPAFLREVERCSRSSGRLQSCNPSVLALASPPSHLKKRHKNNIKKRPSASPRRGLVFSLISQANTTPPHSLPATEGLLSGSQEAVSSQCIIHIPIAVGAIDFIFTDFLLL